MPGLRRRSGEPEGLMAIEIVARCHPRHCDLDHADGEEDRGPVTAMAESKPAGATPRTVKEWPFTRSVWPTISRADPKWVFQ